MPDKNPVSDGLVLIHKVITRNLRNAIRKCKEYELDKSLTSQQTEGFNMYLSTLRRITHSHHLAEDTLVFPYFKQSIDGPYERLEDEHRIFEKSLEDLDRALSVNSQARYGRIARILGKIDSMWAMHIKLEEEFFSPEIINSICDATAQNDLIRRVAEHGSRNSGPAPLSLPFIMYSLHGNDRKEMLSQLPWIVRKILVPFVWKSKWKPMKPFLLNAEK